jgi:uronate dehydrogenase
MKPLTVLVTGPGGRIGPHILPSFRERYTLRLLDRKPIEGEPDTIVADLSDIPTLRQAFTGVDVVLHLAATSDEAPFVEELVPNNIVGVYNVYQAAVEAGVRRVVFASTIQTIGYFPQDYTVQTSDIPRPITTYGCTKVFGETLGRWFHDRHGLEVVCIRIGAFQPYDSPHFQQTWCRNNWLSPRDAVGVFSAAIEKEGLGYGIVFGTSLTEFERVSRQPIYDLLGYVPQDDVTMLYPQNPLTD